MSADVEFLSRFLYDENLNPYVLDNDCGLVDLQKESGGCKNLSFRNLMSGNIVN